MTGPACRRRALLGSLAACSGLRFPAVASARDADDPDGVDVLLVLAVDVSCSISDREMRLQREGYGAALRHDDVLDALGSGLHGAIGLAYLQWAGLEYQRLIVPWTRNGSRRDAVTWSERMERAAVAAQGEAEAAAFPNGSMTSTAAGIQLAVATLRRPAQRDAERRSGAATSRACWHPPRPRRRSPCSQVLPPRPTRSVFAAPSPARCGARGQATVTPVAPAP